MILWKYNAIQNYTFSVIAVRLLVHVKLNLSCLIPFLWLVLATYYILNTYRKSYPNNSKMSSHLTFDLFLNVKKVNFWLKLQNLSLNYLLIGLIFCMKDRWDCMQNISKIGLGRTMGGLTRASPQAQKSVFFKYLFFRNHNQQSKTEYGLAQPEGTFLTLANLNSL